MAQPSSPDRGQMAEFVQHLTAAQSRLYTYICTLLGSASGAADVLQETNVALWEKAEQFDPAAPFMPWAYRFAHFQVMACRKRHARSRLVFDDALLALVAEEYHRGDGDLECRLEALDECLKRLPSRQRALIHDRYAASEPVAAIAARVGLAANAVSANLYRLRKALLGCIEARLGTEERP